MLIRPDHGIGCILLCILALSHLSPVVDATGILRSILGKSLLFKKLPATSRTVILKGCDKTNDIRVVNEQTITGRVEVEANHCYKRFKNDAARIAALQKVVLAQLKFHHQQLFKTSFNHQVTLQVIGGDKKHVVFSFTIKVAKIHHDKVRSCMKKTCQDEEVKKKIADESLKRPGDDDSSSSEEEPAEIPAQTPVKEQPAKDVKVPGDDEVDHPHEEPKEEPKHEIHFPIEEAPLPHPVQEPHKPNRKPSRPVQVDCNNGHRITVNNDKQINGVLVVKLCRSKLFIRKQKRCSSVRDKLAALLHGGLTKFGIKEKYNLNLVKTIGSTTQTEFHYTVQCDKARQSNVITCLKDACKDKSLIDTITHEKQPDSSESSSEGD